jgi:hypothetical protein
MDGAAAPSAELYARIVDEVARGQPGVEPTRMFGLTRLTAARS